MTAETVDDFFTFSAGYMGQPNLWCYWETERPGDGSTGPFDCEQDARDNAQCALDDTEDVE